MPFSLGWQLSANGHLTDGAVVYRSGQPLFLLASLGRTLYALDEDGQIVWQMRTRGPVYSLAVPGEERVAIGDDAGNVSLIHTNGRPIWHHDLGSRVTALHTWQDGLLAGGWDERLTFLGLGGQVHWQVAVDGPVSSIAVLNDLALTSTLNGVIVAFDQQGARIWSYDAGVPVTTLGIVGEGPDASVLVGIQDGRLLALEVDGSLRWQRLLGENAGSPVWHVANLAGGSAPEIVTGSGGREPYLALLSGQGDWLWRVAVPAAVGAVTSVDLDGDGSLEILAGLAGGEIQAYDGQGRLRGSIHAGLSVWGLDTETSNISLQEVPARGGSVLVRADVVAWQIVGVDGQRGGPWLSPPAMVSDPSDFLPAGTRQADTQGDAILTFLGDVAPGRSMEAQLARYGPSYPWEGLGPLLRGSDLAVANLECMLTTQGEPLKKRYLIRAHPQRGENLVAAGLDLMTVANNHALDYGQPALDETLVTLETLGIATVGAGGSQAEAHRPALFTLNGVRVAVLGYAAARWNGSVDVPVTEQIAWARVADVQADVQAVRKQADFVVVLLHAGTEYAAEPSPDQVAVAHAAVIAGADLVVGHHPHVTQTVEQYEESLIVYSLGDALFDIPRPAAMRGDLLRVHITREGLVQAELWPFWIDDAIQPRLLDDGQGSPQFKIVYP